jgi:cytoskeletal protein CcmA (bactofilin family)
MIFKAEGKGSDLNGFLDRGSHLQGELAFEATFRVDGRFSGTVKSKGDLIVGEAGDLDGHFEVGQLLISGTVRGTVSALRKIEITSTGKVFADIETPSLIVGDGAHFEGRCSMARGAATPETREATPKDLPRPKKSDAGAA